MLALTSTLITSLALLVPNALLHVAGEGTGKNLLGPGMSVALPPLLQRGALFGGGDLTQQYLTISLTPAVGTFMTPSMLICNSGLTIPIVVTKH